MATEVVASVYIDVQHCCACGIPFGMERGYMRQRRDDKYEFYCPNGHAQHYLGKALRQELAETNARLVDVRAERDRLAEDNMALATKNRTLTQRAKAGVCAFCRRSFPNVKQHMQTQHPKRRTT